MGDVSGSDGYIFWGGVGLSGGVPEGWAKKPYKELGDVLSGFAFKSKLFSEDSNDFPLIRIRNLLSHTTETYYSGEFQDEYVVDDGDILIGMDGEFHTVRWDGGKALLNQRICKVIPKATHLDEGFSFYTMLKEIPKINNQTASTTVKHLSTKDVKNLEILLPPLPEQKKIAAILSSVDDTIAKTKAVIAQTEKLKQGLMQELLTKGIGHTKFKKTEIGEIPESWQVMDLIDLSTDGINNGVFRDPKKVGSGYRLINVSDMYSLSKIETDSLERLQLEEKVFLKNKVEYGDLFFTRSSIVPEGIAYTNVNLSRDDDLTFDGHLMKVRPNQELINPLFLAIYCRSFNARRILISRGKPSAMTTIAQSDIANFPVIVPPIDEQNQIAETINSLNETIKQNEVSIKSLLFQKESLMKQLLTGQVRTEVS